MSISPIVLHPKTKQTPPNLLQKTHSSPPQNAHGKQTKTIQLSLQSSSQASHTNPLDSHSEEKKKKKKKKHTNNNNNTISRGHSLPKKKLFFLFFSFFLLTYPSMHLEVSAALSFG
jgi:hypothetical protein